MTSLLKYKPRRETKLLIIHDSHTLPNVCTTEDVPRWAILAHEGGLKMGLLSIGYHFIVERDGTVVSCRPKELVGSHSPGHNLDSIGICLVGGREEVGLGPYDDYQQPHSATYAVDNFTKEQRLALLGLMHELKAEYPGVRIKGHSEVQRYRNREHPKCPSLDMDLLREDSDLYAKGYVL